MKTQAKPNLSPLGTCNRCSDVAYVQLKKGISPGVWTEPELLCNDCLDKDRKAMLKAAGCEEETIGNITFE